MPEIEQTIDCQLRLNLGKGVPVAIVVVARVMMVELGWRGSLGRCPESLLVPVRDNVGAIGIEGRHQENNRLVEYLLNLGTVLRGETIGEFRAHKRPSHFC